MFLIIYLIIGASFVIINYVMAVTVVRRLVEEGNLKKSRNNIICKNKIIFFILMGLLWPIIFLSMHMMWMYMYYKFIGSDNKYKTLTKFIQKKYIK